MKTLLTITIFNLIPLISFSQLEFNLSQSWEGIANVNGLGINTGYEIPINSKVGIKPQLAYKCLCSFYEFTGTDFENKRGELHLTGYYFLIANDGYKLKPNIGLNLSYSNWQAQMVDPLDQRPIRSYVTELRNGDAFAVSSTSDNAFKELDYLTLGFSAQLKNQFHISDKLDINITPFIEMDYDRTQVNGGGYLGVTYKR